MRVAALGLVAITAFAVIPANAGDDLRQAYAALDAYDYPRALAPLRSAAARGDLRAQRLLGFMLLHGEQLYRGIRADRAEALSWLRKAAAQGEEQAAWFVARDDAGRAPDIAVR